MLTRTAWLASRAPPGDTDVRPQTIATIGKLLIIVCGMSRPRRSVFTPKLTERFRRLPCLLVADVGVAHGGADILVAEQLLDFPQILSHVVKQNRRRGMAQPVRGDLPHPEGSACRPQPQVERAVGKRLARISRKHKLRGRKGDPAGSQDPAAFKTLLDGLPFKERRTQAPGDRHILEDASLAFDPESDNFLPHPLAIAPGELDQFIEPAGGLEEGVGQVEREGGAISLLPDFE